MLPLDIQENTPLLSANDAESFFKRKNFKSCVCEAVGTFFLCTTIALVAGQEGDTSLTSFAKDAPLAPLAIGLTLMVMVFAFGHISGAHFNPAVTLGVFLRGDKIEARVAVFYVISQLIGGFAAAGVTKFIASDAGFVCGFPMVNEFVSPVSAIVLEAIYTFALVLVVLNSATTKSQSGNSFFGLAIGMTVASAAWAAGALSGGAFNPAVGTALPFVSGAYSDIWIYWVGPCLGAYLAATFFKFTVEPSEFEA